VLCLGVACLTAAAPPPARPWDERAIALPLVGTGNAFVPHVLTGRVAILVSDAAGWNSAMIEQARRIAASGAVVIGIPYPALRRHAARESGCWYVAADFELISHAAQKALKLPQYHPPVLVGVGAAAPIVYAAAAGGPAVTFRGVVSIGFCPEIHLAREICSGDNWDPEYDEARRVSRLPAKKTLPKDWWLLETPQHRACSPALVRQYAAAVPTAHVGTSLAAALQDLWTEKETKPPAAQPRSATMRELEEELQKLPLPFEFRWPAAPLNALMVFFSGDGGWASLDEEVAEHLVAHGVGVVGVSSLRYFWTEKTPAQVAGDVRQIAAVLQKSGKPIFAGGFSFGAEVVPVALTAWNAAERRQLTGIVMIAPGLSASFEIDPLDWIRTPEENPASRVAPAVRTLAIPALCLAGASEEDSPCPSLAGAPDVRVVRLPGSHHFDNDYAAVGEAVAQFIRTTLERRP